MSVSPSATSACLAPVGLNVMICKALFNLDVFCDYINSSLAHSPGISLALLNIHFVSGPSTCAFFFPKKPYGSVNLQVLTQSFFPQRALPWPLLTQVAPDSHFSVALVSIPALIIILIYICCISIPCLLSLKWKLHQGKNFVSLGFPCILIRKNEIQSLIPLSTC